MCLDRLAINAITTFEMLCSRTTQVWQLWYQHSFLSSSFLFTPLVQQKPLCVLFLFGYHISGDIKVCSLCSLDNIVCSLCSLDTIVCSLCYSDAIDGKAVWYKDGKEVGTFQAKTTFDGRTAKLVLKQFEKRNCGVYECVVRNTGGEAKTKAPVSLLG